MITDDNLANLAAYGKTEVLQKYAYRLMETRRLITALTVFAQNGHNVDLADIHWGHVGDLGHVNEKLSELVKFLEIEE